MSFNDHGQLAGEVPPYEMGSMTSGRLAKGAKETVKRFLEDWKPQEVRARLFSHSSPYILGATMRKLGSSGIIKPSIRGSPPTRGDMWAGSFPQSGLTPTFSSSQKATTIPTSLGASVLTPGVRLVNSTPLDG